MYAIKAMTRNGQCCIKDQINGFEISLAFDDSCGVLSECYRGDLRIYNTLTDQDVTNEVFSFDGVVSADFNNFERAVKYCNTHFAKRN